MAVRPELTYEKGQPGAAPMWQWTRQRLQATTPGSDQLADAVWFAGYVHAEDPSLPGVDRQQDGKHPQARRLPRAVGAEDAEDLALAYMKVDREGAVTRGG